MITMLVATIVMNLYLELRKPVRLLYPIFDEFPINFIRLATPNWKQTITYYLINLLKIDNSLDNIIGVDAISTKFEGVDTLITV